MPLTPYPATAARPLAGRPARTRWNSLAAPSRFYAWTGQVLPWCWGLALLLCAAGLYAGLLCAPVDAQQGQSYRILFVHVPAAWLSMVVYLAMAGWAAWGWMASARMASMYARALAPSGALYTLLALVTGALWGQPTWGTWWVWDARLTSEFILLLLYIGYIALTESIDEPRRVAHAGALLTLVGAVNVPIIYGSVRWWNTLHQGATIRLGAAPSMTDSMLLALVLMTLGLWAACTAAVLTRARAIVLDNEADADWVQALAHATPALPASATPARALSARPQEVR